MGNVIYSMITSLDGFIEDTDGKTDWAIVDEELHRYFNDLDRSRQALLFGRRLFEDMRTFWPEADQDPTVEDFIIEYAHIWKEKPKYVFSNTLDSVVDDNTILIKGNAAEKIANLKAQSAGDFSLSGAGLAASCIEQGLVDEYMLFVNPVVLGSGKPAFPSNVKESLRHIDTRTFGCGVVMLHYQS